MTRDETTADAGSGPGGTPPGPSAVHPDSAVDPTFSERDAGPTADPVRPGVAPAAVDPAFTAPPDPASPTPPDPTVTAPADLTSSGPADAAFSGPAEPDVEGYPAAAQPPAEVSPPFAARSASGPDAGSAPGGPAGTRAAVGDVAPVFAPPGTTGRPRAGATPAPSAVDGPVDGQLPADDAAGVPEPDGAHAPDGAVGPDGVLGADGVVGPEGLVGSDGAVRADRQSADGAVGPAGVVAADGVAGADRAGSDGDGVPSPADVTLPPELAPAARTLFGDRLDLAAAYAELLATEGVLRGLIGPREAPRIWERHLLNCAVMAERIPDGASVIDVGSGAGLPGIVLAIARPDLTVTLVEPLARRTGFLIEAVERLGLARTVRVFRGRAEEAAAGSRDRTPLSADVVTARAVAALDRLAAWCLPLAVPGGRLVALKGASAAEEIAEHGAAVARLGGGEPELYLCGVDVIDPPATVVEVVRERVVGPARKKGPKRSRGGRRRGGGGGER